MSEREPLAIGEARGFALLQTAAFRDTVSELERIVRSVLGVDLPKRSDTPTRAAERCVFRVGPEQFWVTGPAGAWAAALRDAVPASVGSVTPLSNARVRMFIEGPSAREVLSRGIALDLHPEVFPCEACALVALQDTPVLLHRAGPQRYELYVLSTFAGWIWEWLTDAALPFGYRVVAAPHSAMSADGGTGR